LRKKVLIVICNTEIKRVLKLVSHDKRSMITCQSYTGRIHAYS